MSHRDEIIHELVTLCNSITRKPGESKAHFVIRAVETAWNHANRAATCIMQVYPYRNGELLAVSYFSKAKKDLDFIEVKISELVEH